MPDRIIGYGESGPPPNSSRVVVAQPDSFQRLGQIGDEIAHLLDADR